MRKLKKALLTAACVTIACGSAMAAPRDSLSDTNRAQEELTREEGRIYREAAKDEAKTVSPGRAFVPVSSVSVTGNKKMTEDEVLALLPELKKKTVSIRKLSRQIQMVNDTGGLRLGADLKPDKDGCHVTVSVEEKKSDHVALSAGNTGNDYTGDWRLSASYINTNATHHADTFGAAVVTSPGHWDDVKQAALSYRMLFPKDSGGLTFTASWSDVNLGSVYAVPGLIDYTAAGRGLAFGLHGQKYISYTSRNKDILDFGIEHKSYNNENRLGFSGIPLNLDYDFDVTTLSAGFIHNDRSARHSFTYDLGVAANVGGDRDDYARATPGSDKNFFLWRGGASYQHRTPGNWLIGLRLHGQYTTSNVVSTEQIGAGGIYTVRGFNERVISADTGIVGSFEIFTPEFIPNSRFVLFTDYGALHNNNSSASFGSEKLGSAGIGFRYSNRDLSLRVDYAKILDDISRDLMGRQGHKTWNAVLTMGF